MEHTALPWEIGKSYTDDIAIRELSPDNECVADVLCLSDGEQEANAEFIVRACNSYEALVEACKLAAKYVSKMVADDVQTVIPPANALRVIERALKQAEEN